MTEPTVWCIRVYLKDYVTDYDILVTEPMPEEVARAEFDRLQPTTRNLRDESTLVKIEANRMVRQADIERIELIPLDRDEEEEGIEGEIDID